ncbi:MAG: class I SAM-dependent methyltransferase [Planctomycetota bacterium]
MPAERSRWRRFLRSWRPWRKPGRYNYDRITLSASDIEAKAYQRHLGGGAEQWDRRGRFQAFLLHTLGLQAGDRLLDAGCGPLRAGVHLIEALEPSHYCGIDFNADFIKTARHLVADNERLTAKAPRLECLADFAFQRLAAPPFDWVLAFSVLNHCDAATRRVFFGNLPAVLAPHARVVISHADWFEEGALAGTPLELMRVLRTPAALAPGLDITEWRFASPPEGKLFPIVVVTPAARAATLPR